MGPVTVCKIPGTCSKHSSVSTVDFAILFCCGLVLKCPQWHACVEGSILSFMILGEGSPLAERAQCQVDGDMSLASPASTLLLGHHEVR